MYTIARLTYEQGRAIFGQEMRVLSWTVQLICACLNNADNGSRDDLRTFEEISNLTVAEMRDLVSACLEINGLRKKRTGEFNCQDSEAVPSPRLFLMGGRPFYLRHLSPIERERLRVVALVIRQTPETPLSTEHAFELADIFATAAGMTCIELFRSVENVDTFGLFDALRQVSGFPASADGRTYFDIGVSSA